MRNIRFAILVGFSLGLGSCAQPTPKMSTNETTPANVSTYDAKRIAVGTEWAWKTVRKDGSSTIRYRVDDIVNYRGRKAYRIRYSGGTHYRDLKTFNLLAIHNAKNRPTYTAKPYLGILKWPLFVGKKYSITYDVDNIKEGRSWEGVTPTWTVEAAETITVPAGTFKTLRIKSGPGPGVGFDVTAWFAPDLGLFIKTIHVRRKENWRGAGGRRKRVLTAYKPAR